MYDSAYDIANSDPKTFCLISFYIYINSWPPSEDEFFEKETAIRPIPTVTETLLEGILSKREKKSAKVQRIVLSIHCDSRYYLYEIFMSYVFKMSIAIH